MDKVEQSKPEAAIPQMVAAKTNPMAPPAAPGARPVEASDLTFGTNVFPAGARSLARPTFNRDPRKSASAKWAQSMLPRDVTAGSEATAPPPVVEPETLEVMPTQGITDTRSAAADAPLPVSTGPELATTNLFFATAEAERSEEPPQRVVLHRPSAAVNLEDAVRGDAYSEATHPPASPTSPQGELFVAEQLPVIAIEDNDLTLPTEEEMACLEVIEGLGVTPNAQHKMLAEQVMKEEDGSERDEEAEAAAILARMSKEKMDHERRNKKGLKLSIPEKSGEIQGNEKPAASWADEPLDDFLPRPAREESLPPTPETTIMTVSPPLCPPPSPVRTTTRQSPTIKEPPTIKWLTAPKSLISPGTKLVVVPAKKTTTTQEPTTPTMTWKMSPPSKPTKKKTIPKWNTAAAATATATTTATRMGKKTLPLSSCVMGNSSSGASTEEWDRHLDEEMRRADIRRAKRLGKWCDAHPYIAADFEFTDDEDDEVTALVPEEKVVRCLADDPPQQGVGRVISGGTAKPMPPPKPAKKKGKVNQPLKVKLFGTLAERQAWEKKEAGLEARMTGALPPTPRKTGLASKRPRKLLDEYEEEWPNLGKMAIGSHSMQLRRHGPKSRRPEACMASLLTKSSFPSSRRG